MLTGGGTGGGDAVNGRAATALSTGRIDSDKGTVVFDRYYHLFREGELEGLVAAVPGARLADSFYDRDNWCAVLEKLP